MDVKFQIFLGQGRMRCALCWGTVILHIHTPIARVLLAVYRLPTAAYRLPSTLHLASIVQTLSAQASASRFPPNRPI